MSEIQPISTTYQLASVRQKGVDQPKPLDTTVNSFAKKIFEFIQIKSNQIGSTIKNPTIISKVSDVLGSLAAGCSKVLNIAKNFFSQQNEIDQRFLGKSLKDFKGITQTRNYFLPKPKLTALEGPGFLTDESGTTKAKAGANYNAMAMLKSETIATLKELTLPNSKENLTIHIPNQIEKDLSRLPLTICGITNLNSEGNVNIRVDDYADKATIYNDIKTKFEKEGIGEGGLVAACELMQQGLVADLFSYFMAFNDADNDYSIDSANPDKISITASFTGQGDSRVFRIEVTTKNYDTIVTTEKNEKGKEISVNKQEGCITVKRTVDIPIQELREIKLVRREAGLNVQEGVAFSNMPKNITGKDEWSAYTPVHSKKTSIQDQIKQGFRSAMTLLPFSRDKKS